MGYSVEVERSSFQIPEGASFVQAHVGFRAVPPSVTGQVEATLELALSWPEYEQRYGRKARLFYSLKIGGPMKLPLPEVEREAAVGELVDLINVRVTREVAALKQSPVNDEEA